MFAVLATGGTGGHTYPALALAQELVDRGHPRDSIRFVGGRRGLEGRVVPEAGFAIDLLPGRGLQRRMTIENVRTVLDAVVAMVRAILIVRRLRPQVVVGFGGYASLPCVVAARVLRVPTLVHEQDAAPGLANRIATRLGATPAVSLPGTPLPGATVTGNPVRAEIRAVRRAPATPPIVALFGGSLGARTINDAALELYDRWRGRADVRVHHVCGARNFDECERRLADLRNPDDALDYTLSPYEPEMHQLYARSTIAVCRAGAGTIAEVTTAGLPTVLVPLPGAPSDHQTHNARTLESAGAAVLLTDERCTGAQLDEICSRLLADPARVEEMAAAARALARPDAVVHLADFVEGRARAA
ncbi:MAG TPA: undecaprenyldiphospho-muramoylpentapeptide beta-N-acetylglucosaminyltransferase [Acidimicrobiia bacterium]|nr:undecaprenyldiphospho-muramoylpentapeptide beta-N-acetylglucosaminyltransferase [Acidimicrobiia bacterium]